MMQAVVVLAIIVCLAATPGRGAEEPTPDSAAAEEPTPDSAAAEEPTPEEPTPETAAAENPRLDLSTWLLEHHGFLPIPIFITEPAVGYGGGLALAFFRKPPSVAQPDAEQSGRVSTPDIYGLAAFRTENGTDGIGAAGLLHFNEDRWRYKGGLLDADVNLTFHPGTDSSGADGIDYSLGGVYSFQELSRRIGRTHLFIAGRWIYFDLNVGFENATDGELFAASEKAGLHSGLGIALDYDGLDNLFTPSSGWRATFEVVSYAGALGNDASYETYRARVLKYWPIGKRWVLAGRLDQRSARGEVPFYQLPFIGLRGIPLARYQDEDTAVIEAEARFNVKPRWAVVGFSGVGRAWGSELGFNESPSRSTAGAGMRYLLAAKLGLYVGIDLAAGPEEDAMYIQIGNAWH